MTGAAGGAAYTVSGKRRHFSECHLRGRRPAIARRPDVTTWCAPADATGGPSEKRNLRLAPYQANDHGPGTNALGLLAVKMINDLINDF
jgi:hypothetical protein